MNIQHALPNGLANFLDSCGMRPPTPPPSTADLEALGMRVGIEGAKEIIRLGINGKRNPHFAPAVAIFKRDAIKSFAKEAASYLDDNLERAFRKGVDRGLTSQLKHPNARIDIKIVKASAVG